jgi:hypothetical protein
MLDLRIARLTHEHNQPNRPLREAGAPPGPTEPPNL